MTDFTSIEIPRPKDWQAFERHCRLLFEYSLQDPGVQNNGRSGQRQHGVDIFGKRDGAGRQVGIQCKGKDGDYGGEVTEKELKAEVEKTKKFRLALAEFILVTTARDDGKIQTAARLLEEKVRAGGRDLSIQVWGWGRLQQEITRFGEVLKAFHPDATIFTEKLLEGQESTKLIITEGQTNILAEMAEMKQMLSARLPLQISTEAGDATVALDKELHHQIDGYRDLLRAGKPRTALELLIRMKDRLGADASPRVRYRLLSNIGAAHYNLGEYEQAAGFLLEAAPLEPDDPLGVSNRVAALLIRQQPIEAAEVARAAMARFPDSPELALQRIQAREPGETVEAVWQMLSEAAKSAPAVFGFRVGVTRELGDLRWWDLATEGHKRFPDNKGLKLFQADSVIDRILKRDPGGVGLEGSDVPTHDEIRRAAETLEEYWTESQGKETPPQPVCAHNAALGWLLLGDLTRAGKNLDEAIAAGYRPDETLQLRISILRREGRAKEAIVYAEKLPDKPIHRLVRADLQTEIDPPKAREILADRLPFVEENEAVGAYLITLESYLQEKQFGPALTEANALSDSFPGHPQGALARFRVKRASGASDWAADLDAALTLVTDKTAFPVRFLVCEALGSVDRYDDIVSLLSGQTARNFDSPALRVLIAAAVNSDKRATAKQLFEEIPDAVLQQRYYMRARVAFASPLLSGRETFGKRKTVFALF